MKPVDTKINLFFFLSLEYGQTNNFLSHLLFSSDFFFPQTEELKC